MRYSRWWVMDLKKLVIIQEKTTAKITVLILDLNQNRLRSMDVPVHLDLIKVVGRGTTLEIGTVSLLVPFVHLVIDHNPGYKS